MNLEKLSAFLSENLPFGNLSSAPAICLIAGKGRYPELLLETMQSKGLKVYIIGFEEETSDQLLEKVGPEQRTVIKVGQIGHLIKALKKFNVRFALMAGQITPRRLFHGLHLDLKAILMFARLKERNAESIFGAIAQEMAHNNVTLLDARSFLDDHIATPGWMTGPFGKIRQEWVDHGIKIAKGIAALNIGQCVVVSKGTVLAVEGFEGTNELIKRAAQFQAPTPIFVKASNPQHDFRFDVPTFGIQTIHHLHEAQIQHVALEANKVIMLDKDLVLKEAKKLKISLFGFN